LKSIKNHLKHALVSTGLLRLYGEHRPLRISVLFYHGFRKTGLSGQAGGKDNFSPVELFERHLQVILKYAHPASILDLLGERKIPRHAVIITLDDGYANNYTLAFPLLRKYGLPATIFLTTGFIDRQTFLWTDWLEWVITRADANKSLPAWGETKVPLRLESEIDRKQTMLNFKSYFKTLPISAIHSSLLELQDHLNCRYAWSDLPPSCQPLTWSQIREMAACGLITFGSHTVSHPVLSRCSAEVQRQELQISKNRIEEETGEPCVLFAYPNGTAEDYSVQTVEQLREIGYKLAVTTDPGYERADRFDPLRIRRWGADISTTDLAFILAGGADRHGRGD